MTQRKRFKRFALVAESERGTRTSSQRLEFQIKAVLPLWLSRVRQSCRVRREETRQSKEAGTGSEREGRFCRRPSTRENCTSIQPQNKHERRRHVCGGERRTVANQRLPTGGNPGVWAARKAPNEQRAPTLSAKARLKREGGARFRGRFGRLVHRVKFALAEEGAGSRRRGWKDWQRYK